MTTTQFIENLRFLLNFGSLVDPAPDLAYTHDRLILARSLLQAQQTDLGM